MNKKRQLIPGLLIGILVFLGILSVFNTPQTTIIPFVSTKTQLLKITVAPTDKLTITPLPTTKPTVYIAPAQYISPSLPANDQSTSGLSNNNYYQNVDDNEVHSPVYSTNGSVPAGATAQCNDGTYSFSQHHSGTCSRHGGVAQWL